MEYKKVCHALMEKKTVDLQNQWWENKIIKSMRGGEGIGGGARELGRTRRHFAIYTKQAFTTHVVKTFSRALITSSLTSSMRGR